ncbi:MAG: AAA family ATPase, partial [Myxococcota bacterium]
MQITVPVYQQRREQGLQWSTVGLGDLSATRTLGTEAKLKRWLHDTLKEATRNERRALLQLFGPASVRLKRVRLELSFKVRGKKKKTGLFPIILDPRFRTQSERLVLAYHPLRQNDVLIVNEDSLEDQLAPFLAHAWREVPDEDLNALLSDGRDRLRAIAMTLNPPSLLDQLQQQKSPWADLEIDPKREREKDRARRKKKGGPPPILRRLSVDLTERAASGALDAGRPREPLRSQIQQLLCVPRRSPLVLIGPPGAGKRTALRRAVADLLSYEGYDAHRNLDRVTHVYSLSGSRIIAGMSFLGQWEQRCVDILEATQGRRVVLFFEDLHTLGRVGRSRDSERSIGDFFRGPLDRGEVVIIGTATASQWHRLEEDVPSFAAAFTRLRVDPATSDETLRMLLHEARAIESEQRCTFDVEVFRGILEVGAPLLVDQALPGKALDLLRLLARDEGGATRTGVEMDHVLGALSRKTGLYMDVLDKASDLAREDVIHTLQLDVMGQPSATEAVADLIVRIRAGLTDPGRPYGTYLFTGPTGTGKTQLAKALSSYLYDSEDADRLIRFDMGELSGPDAVARLIGDRWSPRGLLTEAVRQEPFCVLLLDEIEKAHRSVLYLLLQLLDDGRLTDAAGDRVDFTRSVIIMTSNLGASPRAAVGFESGESSIRSDVQKAVKEFFPPELFNRIERIVAFEPLSNDTAKSIVEKELTQLLGRRGLTERNVFVFANASASERMVTEAFDSRAGARSVKRYLETRIGTLLAEHLASTARPEMEIIRLYDADGEYRLTSSALREAQPLEGTLALGPLLHASSPALAKALPAVLQDLQSLEEGGALEVLAERLRTHLALVGGSEEH